MLSLVASSVLGGQIIARTGRYRCVGLVSIGVMAVGAFLLALMGTDTTGEVVVRNMIIVGLGLGGTMPLFIIVVQNSVEHARLGVATSSISIGAGKDDGYGAA